MIVSCDGVTRVTYNSHLPPQSLSKMRHAEIFLQKYSQCLQDTEWQKQDLDF